jgi:succinate-semialdehyde dehydrogenase / glutarate-semialdehyde dehydrogenase
MKSINPSTNKILRDCPEHSEQEIAKIIDKVYTEWETWKATSFDFRAKLFRKAAQLLRDRSDTYARLMTLEMGKIIRESYAEVEKCANACDYYADNAAKLLQDQVIDSDASRSMVIFQPIGVVLAVMPWNFPFWQVFRFATTALMAGNAAILKHASNVPGCAMAIEEIFRDAGFPENVFRTLLIPSGMVEQVLNHPKIAAVTLTGSEQAGSQVASTAGRLIKKTVLELGGSDAFIVLDDADMNATVKAAVGGRMVNMGQSCIAAKRFIVVESRVAEFEEKVKSAMEKLLMGDPLDLRTEVGPLARPDLVTDLHLQEMGAKLLLGGKPADRPGNYYLPTILTNIKKGMPVYEQETFGPVMSIIKVKDTAAAIAVANDSDFGLGGCVWTTDLQLGEKVARSVNTGAMFVNGLTKSDPRLPFGGIKKSGYGRELAEFGIREFVNVKTIWMKEA